MSIDILLLGISLASGASTAAGFSVSTRPQHHPIDTSTCLHATRLFPYSGSVRPGKQSPQRTVSEDLGVLLPSYAHDGIPKESPAFLPWVIKPKNLNEIEKMRAAGKLAREVLDLAGRAVEVGVTTDEIDSIVHRAIVEAGAYPSPLNYHDFPKSLCTSVNEVICHGIPDNRKLKDGDIINLDVTVFLDGYHGDCSEMFLAGEPDDKAKELLQTTYDAWITACNHVQSGRKYQEIGGIIEDFIEPRGFRSVPDICGHGIGRIFHDNPNVHHTRNIHHNGEMAVGHTFTIEPMICEGSAMFMEWPDDWTITTADGKRSAQFEHTLLVTEDGVEALTGKNDNSMLHFWEKESKVHQGIWLGTSDAAKERAQEINSNLN